MCCVAEDDLLVEVLTELGRVTWAAIKLEDYTESLCSTIDPANPRTDRRQVSTKIKDAKKVLNGWPTSAARDRGAGMAGECPTRPNLRDLG
jgi:hypothetical protein